MADRGVSLDWAINDERNISIEALLSQLLELLLPLLKMGIYSSIIVESGSA
jgi:hypothetical protein